MQSEYRPAPRIRPGLAAGWLLAFTLSLDDVVLASPRSPGATTLPVYLFSQLPHGVTPDANALALVTLGVGASAMVALAATRGRH